VIQRHSGGFPLDQCRGAYLRYLRRERRQSPRAEADAEHTAAKATLLRIKIAQTQRELMRREDADALLDEVCGVVLMHLSGLAARCSNDLAVRAKIEATVRQIRHEIAEHCIKVADERNEPPLDQQG
jgi:hypothetical protein